MKAPSLTIGIEEEYQIIDPVTGELKSYITQILDDGKLLLKEQIKAELHQSMVEVGTEICNTPAEAKLELIKLRRTIMQLAGKHGLVIAAAGSHPFSAWQQQEITPYERYLGVKNDMGDLAQQLLIFGTHVHIGIEDKEFLIDAMNVARYFVPHILCLSTSSPFWIGRNTGLKSYRSIIFRNFPRSGIPPKFSNWDEFEGMVDTMVKTRCIPAESPVPDAGIPRLRRLHENRRVHLHRGHFSGHHRQAVEAAAGQPHVPQLPDGTDRGEQVAGRPLRPGRQVVGPRQADGSARPGLDS